VRACDLKPDGDHGHADGDGWLTRNSREISENVETRILMRAPAPMTYVVRRGRNAGRIRGGESSQALVSFVDVSTRSRGGGREGAADCKSRKLEIARDEQGAQAVGCLIGL